ncbi:MAG: choice-of-anchor L domain-containing protein [Saprospiraceae bacterium]
MKKYCFLIALMLGGHLAFGQSMEITNATSPPFDPQNLISAVFLGDGVQIKNIAFSGSAQSVGYFDKGLPFVGIQRGIVMTTGLAVSANTTTAIGADANAGEFAASPTNSVAFDPNLANLAGGSIADVAMYDITFVPSADTLRFDYVFASEEYPEFACSPFNDVFGFFIQGPGYPTPTNIALIPGTSLPVTINNLHPENLISTDSCPPLNAQLYLDRLATFPFPQPVFDGMTTVLTAIAVVQPCQEYHIRLAIADVLDQSHDSGVFLAAKSFGTNALQVDVQTTSPEGVLAEGCASGTLTFRLHNAASAAFNIDYNLFGNTTNGVDYQTIPVNLSIPPGQTQVSIPLVALTDALAEGEEFIGIDVRRDPCTRDTFIIRIRENPLVAPVFPADSTLCQPASALTLDATVNVPLPDPPSFSNTQDLPLLPAHTPLFSSINVNGVFPKTLTASALRSVCVNLEHPWIEDVDLMLVSPGGQFVELTTDNGQNGDNYTNTCFTPTATTPINFPLPAAPAAAAPFTGNWIPEGNFSDLWDYPANGVWQLRLTDDSTGQDGVLKDWSITFEPSYSIQYQWSPIHGLSCPSCPVTQAFPTQTTLYTVQIADSYGCTLSDSIRIGMFSLSIDPVAGVLCSGDSVGVLNTVVDGGAPPYKYAWNNGKTSSVLTDVVAGTYAVTVTDNSGCTDSASIVFTNPSPLEVNTIVQDAKCALSTTGSIKALVSGGVQPYQYLWNDAGAQSGPTATGLGIGNYMVVVKDANGCSALATAFVGEPLPMVLNLDPDENKCSGSTDGSVQSTIQGGTAPFQYIWNTGANTSDIDSIGEGSYTLTVTDANNCTVSATATITALNPILLQTTVTNVLCYGDTTGSIALTVNGGAGGYTIQWTGPGGATLNGAVLNNLSAGAYSYRLVDAVGCSLSDTIILQQPGTPLLSDLPLQADTLCFGAQNGVLQANISGGVSPYAYLWNTGNVGPIIENLGPGTYQLTVVDANGCKLLDTAAIIQKGQMRADLEAQDATCFYQRDGRAGVVAVFYGQTPIPLQQLYFSWNTQPIQTGAQAIGILGGQTLRVTVTDAGGCSTTNFIAVGRPEAIVVSVVDLRSVSCPGDNDGSVVVHSAGGMAPYQYSWSPQPSMVMDSLAVGLRAGQYSVVSTDMRGCTASLPIEMPEPDKLKADIAVFDVSCYGDSSGILLASPKGGSKPYFFQWSNGSNQPGADNLPAGTHVLTLSDSRGCILVDSVLVSQPLAALEAIISTIMPTCHGAKNGSLQIQASGGSPPYAYALNDKPFNGSPLQIGLGAGDYAPNIMDDKGCLLELPVVRLAQPDPLAVELGPNLSIVLGRDTQLFAQVLNNRGPVYFDWSAEDEPWLSCLDCPDPLVQNLEYERYFTLEASDSAGCTAEDQVRIQVLKPRKVFVPTGFSPNGDNNNDLLLLHGQSNTKVLSFAVYDRWGEQVFASGHFFLNDPAAGWDGQFQGKPCDPGVFVWVLEVEYSDGVKDIYKGNTTLVR